MRSSGNLDDALTGYAERCQKAIDKALSAQLVKIAKAIGEIPLGLIEEYVEERCADGLGLLRLLFLQAIDEAQR